MFANSRKAGDVDRGTNLPGMITLTGAFCTLKLANLALWPHWVNIDASAVGRE